MNLQAMSRVLAWLTTVSGVIENPIVDTKNEKILRQFCLK